MEPVDALELKPVLTEAEKKDLLEQAIQKRERLAESELEMAKLFIEKGKPEIALRRLRQVASEFDGSVAAEEARALLATM